MTSRIPDKSPERVAVLPRDAAAGTQGSRTAERPSASLSSALPPGVISEQRRVGGMQDLVDDIGRTRSDANLCHSKDSCYFHQGLRHIHRLLSRGAP